MLKNYLIIASRNLWKNKVSTFVNLICLAVGMTCCMLIVVYLKDELSFNRFNSHYENIYRIDWTSKSSGQVESAAVTPVPLAKVVLAEVPQIKDIARLYQRSGGMELQSNNSENSNGKKFQEQGVYFSDNNLFSIFTIPFLKGDRTRALMAPNSIVITDEMAKKYYGDKDPIGNLLLYDTKTILRITGVVQKMPSNSDLQFDFLISFETLFSVEPKATADFIRTDWTYNPVYTYCLLNASNKIKEVEAALNQALYKHGNERNKQLNTVFLQPLKKIHLHASNIGGNPSTGNITYIYIFGGIALLILFIATVNFINLATAQASARSKEVGMRKVLGATRKQLVFQFLSEALMISFAALVVAFFLTQLMLPVLNELTGKQLNIESWLNLRTLTLFVFVFFITGITAGAYPAFFISRFNPISSLKGKSGETSKKNILRKTLLVTQFSISILLIVTAIFVYQQLHYMRNQPLGFQKEQIISIPIFGSGATGLGNGVDKTMRQRMNSFSNELTKLSRIKSVTAASALPGQWYIPGLIIPEGFTEKDNIFIPWLCVDYNFISTLKIPLIEGREFSKKTGTDHLSAFIINESAVKAFGWKNAKDAVGKNLIRGDAVNGKKGQVIGVVKDHHFNTLDQPMQPLVMDVSVDRFSFFAVNVQPDHLPETINHIKQQWDLIFPERVFEYSFLDSDINALYQDNENLSKVIGYFALIAILLSCLGLFSLSSFLTIQRTKEIGIRKILGAGINRILILLSMEFLKLVCIAFLIATPLAFYMVDRWLQNYAYKIEIRWWVFLIAGMFVLLVTALTVILQSSKAALANPVKSLRTE